MFHGFLLFLLYPQLKRSTSSWISSGTKDVVTTLGNFSSDLDSSAKGFKWNEGTLGLDGRIYCAPAMHRDVGLLVVEPSGFGWTPEVSRYFPPSFVRMLRYAVPFHGRFCCHADRGYIRPAGFCRFVETYQ